MTAPKCEECSHEINENDDKCSNCGLARSPKSEKNRTIILSIVLFVSILVIFGPNEKKQINSFDNQTTEETVNNVTTNEDEMPDSVESKEDYIATIKREIDQLEKYESRNYDSALSIRVALAFIDMRIAIIERNENHSLNGDETLLLKKLKDKMIAHQSKIFPKLRDDFGPVTRNILWEHDLSARTFGAGFRTIEFTGAAFAANRNIKEMQVEMYSGLSRLRFKQSRYKWFKEADEYTFYNIKSPDDTKLVRWIDDITYREIK